jgi:uncharacterized protein (TIGR02391 family)
MLARMLNWLEPEQILRTTPEQLGVLILRFLPSAPDDGWWGAHNFTINYLAYTRPSTPGVTTWATGDELLRDNGPVALKLREAWSWLDREGYVVPDPGQTPGSQWRVVSERGRELLALPPGDELRAIQATATLGDDLHRRIERLVRREWNAGDYESAIFKAAREVEIAVGEALGPTKGKLYGVDVINAAFGKGKPLSDPAQDPGEQEGTRALYAGFIGTFKNPGSHRHFEPKDPIQAADIIRTADLLMRMLDDRVAQLRSAQQT